MKTRSFSPGWLRHSYFCSELSNSFALVFSPFWKIYDNVLNRMGGFCKFENLDSFRTNFNMDTVTRPFYYDWLQLLEKISVSAKNFIHTGELNWFVADFQQKIFFVFSVVLPDESNLWLHSLKNEKNLSEFNQKYWTLLSFSFDFFISEKFVE